jgi:ATP-dependent DNA helicase PIF1
MDPKTHSKLDDEDPTNVCCSGAGEDTKPVENHDDTDPTSPHIDLSQLRLASHPQPQPPVFGLTEIQEEQVGKEEKEEKDEEGDASILLSDDQLRALGLVLSGQSVLITGPGGVGKTVLIRQIYEKAVREYSKVVAVTALTGAAACLMTDTGARTLHSWGGILIRDDLSAEEKAKKIIRYNPEAMRRWMRTDILVIDEVSMMSPALAREMDVIAREIRGYAGRTAPERAKPFGGLQIVFVGDFFQLPPVLPRGATKTFVFEVTDEEHARGKEHLPPFAQVIRKRSQVVVLRKNFRQEGDHRFQKLLGRARYGKLTEDDIALLETRVRPPPKTGVIPTRIFPTRLQVEEMNEVQMKLLDKSTEQIFEARTMERHFQKMYVTNPETGRATTRKVPEWRPLPRPLRVKIAPEDNNPEENPGGFTEQAAVDELDKGGRYDPKLTLRLGAQVMITSNLDVKQGIVNGTRGVVRELNKTLRTVKLELLDGRMYDVTPIVFESGYARLGREQFPLILAWAITTHKSQGLTLDSAEIDLGMRIFAEGQAYVALSRVRSLEGLYLRAFSPRSVRASPIVVEFGKSVGDVVDD